MADHGGSERLGLDFDFRLQLEAAGATGDSGSGLGQHTGIVDFGSGMDARWTRSFIITMTVMRQKT